MPGQGQYDPDEDNCGEDENPACGGVCGSSGGAVGSDPVAVAEGQGCTFRVFYSKGGRRTLDIYSDVRCSREIVAGAISLSLWWHTNLMGEEVDIPVGEGIGECVFGLVRTDERYVCGNPDRPFKVSVPFSGDFFVEGSLAVGLAALEFPVFLFARDSSETVRF